MMYTSALGTTRDEWNDSWTAQQTRLRLEREFTAIITVSPSCFVSRGVHSYEQDIIGGPSLCPSKQLRLWDVTESPSSQRSLRVLLSSLVRTLDTSEWGCTYYLYFIAKTPKFSVCFQEATIFPRGLHFWDQHFSFYQYFEIEFFLYQWLLGYYKANTFLETFSEN